MDASTIDLCLSVFPWASFRKAKGGIKLHVAMNHKGHLPEFVTVTEARTHEVNEGRRVDFPKGSIVAVDRGYTDYEWYKTLTDKGIYFVARLKSNATVRIVERRAVIRSKGVSSDHTIEFTGVTTSKRCPIHLRRIRYRDATTGKRYEFLTNNFALAANTIAAIYKSRWQIELFFKWIKQNLKIKSFMGTSKNAVMTQIWIALRVYLMIAYLKFVSKSKKSMQQILNLLHMNLFEKWCIHDLIHGRSTERIHINPDQLSFVGKLTGH
jgi:putative transposase